MRSVWRVKTADDKADASKEALKALNEFVGQWKGDGQSRVEGVKPWKESADWAWVPVLFIGVGALSFAAEMREVGLFPVRSSQLGAAPVKVSLHDAPQVRRLRSIEKRPLLASLIR